MTASDTAEPLDVILPEIVFGETVEELPPPPPPPHPKSANDKNTHRIVQIIMLIDLSNFLLEFVMNLDVTDLFSYSINPAPPARKQAAQEMHLLSWKH